MQKSKVALIRVDSYDEQTVLRAFTKGMNLLGGYDEIFGEIQKVLLKPNLLSPQPPEKSVTTHPSVFFAVAQYLKNNRSGLEITYGDSAPKGTTEKILRTTGIKEVADKLDVSNVNFEEKVTVSNVNGLIHKQFSIAKPVHETEGLINIAKLKTHHLTRISAAVKNIFGVIPGLMKPEFHVKLPGVQEFCQMLVELNGFVNAKLHVIDAIVAMEGNGPNAGVPRKLNCLIMSSDPVAADSVSCRLMDLQPDRVLTNVLGEENHLGQMTHIEILGDDLNPLICRDFQVQRGVALEANVAWKYRYLKNLIAIRPVINQTKCIKCGECIRQCPAQPIGINWNKKSGFPEYHYSSCIRCYCCQEVCPREAIEARKPLIRKIIDRIFS
ncbi:MAG: DUF362 domain-containing protein [Candidatus Marinimicrobia bacterium]|nr:DUF362 domain-containing protein [Candidatus Neomarinimicrobiota bacterium]